MDDVTTALTRLRELALQLGEFAPVSFSEPAPAEDISALESAVGGPLPSELGLFFTQTNDIRAMDVWNGYWIGGAAGIARMLGRSDPPRVIQFNDEQQRALQIATDGGGNVFVMAGRNTSPVWKWRHETGELTHVADSFSQFLMRVADDWHHFLLDDPDWNYLAG